MQGFWFGLIAVLWAGFFLLEGFDFGVGMLLPLVARSDVDRRIALRSIGPVWDGNEVWLITAGGATFAAFPDWYASVFSGFYLAFALLLGGLILRGIGIEYRGHVVTARGRQWCDAATFVGSLLPALLLGVAFADFLRGVQLDADHDMTGGFFSLLSPYALLGGLVTLSLFAFHGATFLTLRTEGRVPVESARMARLLGPVAGVLAVVFVVWTAQLRGGALSVEVGGVLVIVLVAGILASRAGQPVGAFAATAVTAALVPVWAFTALWPNVLPARNNSAWSLTVHNASSSPYTLKVMTGVALIVTPIVLAYEGWTYWVFRARITGELATGHGCGDGPLAKAVAKAGQSARETFGLGPAVNSASAPDSPAGGSLDPAT